MSNREDDAQPIVVKVGGSLFDLRDLGQKLRAWLHELPTTKVLLVPGGGPTANVIRDLDRWHALGEERSHWLALFAMTLNAHFLATLLETTVIAQLTSCPAAWAKGDVPILDMHAFAQQDEGRPGALPHRWSVTSDSFAARVAFCLEAGQLILLKSIDVARDVSWAEAGRRGFVDPYFAELIQDRFSVTAVNLRRWQPSQSMD